MKKVMVFALLLLLVPAVIAKEDAGTLPSSFLWKADLFFERMNVALTFDTAEKIRIHLAHAAERLAEAQADEDNAELAMEQRAVDMNHAYDLFEDVDVTADLVTDVHAQLVAQANTAAAMQSEDALDQQAELEIAVASYDVAGGLTTVVEETAAPITAAVVVEQELAEDTDHVTAETDEVEETETEDTSTEQIAELKTSDSIIQVTIEDADLAYVHIYINGIEKNFALATGHPPAIIKEISKRTFLTIEEVEAITIFTGP